MARQGWFRWWMIPAGVPVAGLLCCAGGFLTMGPCGGLYWRHGVWEVGHCPTGTIRVTADISGHNLLRGSDDGRVNVAPVVRWVARNEASPRSARASAGTSADLVMLDDQEGVVEGFAVRESSRSGWGHELTVAIPELPDGDYVFRSTVHIPGDEIVVEMPVALYAPAIAHLATDRPLYKPGQEVLLRSVLLRRTDQAPLEDRPGRWRITDPQGRDMLREKDRAGPWGVADTTFQLDAASPAGTWTATWESGDASDSVTFDVRPFRLPRFTVEASSTERWFHPGESAAIEGTARYTSGAPVANAAVQVRLAVSEGRWPLPVAWEAPIEVRTDAQGVFTADIGEVPTEELLTRDKVVIGASIRVTDETGEAAVGGSRVIISADDVRAEVLTELGAGLVGGFNNRAWIRVTTPDGVPVRGAALDVGNPFDPQGRSWDAETDEDGVAALQVDPGEPVSVPQPPVPVRVRPRVPEPVRLVEATTLPEGRSLDLAERRALDRLHRGIARCGYLAPGGATVNMGVRVGPSGSVQAIDADDTPVGDCVSGMVRTLRLAPGSTRTLKLGWAVPDDLRPDLPVTATVAHGTDPGVQSVLRTAAIGARSCLSRGDGRNGARLLRGHWTLTEGRASIDAIVESQPGTGLSRSQQGCIERATRGLRLAEAAPGDGMGTFEVRLTRQGDPSVRAAQATFTTAYALRVEAQADAEVLGSTTTIVPVGSVPALRVRMTPALPAPGEEVTVQVLRGPDFYGTLPEKVALHAGSKRLVEDIELDPDKPVATVEIPASARGFLHVDVREARGVVFVRRPDPLGLTLSTDKPAYPPGAIAKLTVQTRAGDEPVAAGVGLMGVDTTLGQLAPLLGPDDLGRVTVRAEADEPAFGTFDPRALALGQIRGENAAAAAVLRISQLPTDYAGDAPASGSGSAQVDDVEVLTRRFWRARSALVERVRAWEEKAPEDEQLTHERQAAFWTQTLADLEEAGKPAQDAFGRPLTLDVLPDSLVARLDPREVAADGTRLPEDVTSWTGWVDAEVRR